MTGFWRTALAVPLMLMAACRGEPERSGKAEQQDPIEARALSDPIMSDPDLANQDRANDAIAITDPRSMAVPQIDMSNEAKEAARTDAARLAGGLVSSAPEPQAGPATALSKAETAGQLAAAIRGPGSDCPSRIAYSAIWATRLAGPFAIYPRGHVQEAAGTDDAGCRLRAVVFLTPVAVSDVVDFYHTRLRAGGYVVEYRLEGGDHVLRGSKGQTAYAVLVRQAGDGATEVSLTVNGA